MFSRTAAILLAFVALLASASIGAAQPRGDHGRGWGGGFGGGFHQGGGFRGPGPFGGGGGREGRFGGGPRGFGGWGDAPRGGGWRGAGDGGGFRERGGPGYERGYERGGFRDAPPAFAGRSYTSPPVRSGPPAPRTAPGGGYRSAFDGDWRAQQNEVRQTVREGRHIPLNQAIEAVRRRAPGRELDAGIEAGPDGRSVYRLRWAGQNGRRQDYLVDAGSGAIVGVLGGP